MSAFIISGVSCCCRLASDARRARKRFRAVSSEPISFTSFSLYPSFLWFYSSDTTYVSGRWDCCYNVKRIPKSNICVISVFEYTTERKDVAAGMRVRKRILFWRLVGEIQASHSGSGSSSRTPNLRDCTPIRGDAPVEPVRSMVFLHVKHVCTGGDDEICKWQVSSEDSRRDILS